MSDISDTSIRVRIDSGTKARAQERLAQMGLTISDAVRMLLVRISDDGRFPFAPEVPNAVTQKAIRDLRAGKAVHYATADDALKDLGI